MGFRYDGLAFVLSRRKYAVLFIALAAMLLPAYAILTDVIFLSPLSVNPGLRPLETALVACVAVLASLGLTVAAFQVFELRIFSKSGLGSGILGAGAGGTALATFASACTVCQPVWLFWLGFGSATSFLSDYSIYILVASLAILAYSLNSGLAFIARGCRAMKGKK